MRAHQQAPEPGQDVQEDVEVKARPPLDLGQQARKEVDGMYGGSAGTLPHLDRIQESFGDYDVSGARAQVGGEAADAAAGMNARAFTAGDKVGFAEAPDLHTAAHEAAHVVEQRQGISLKAIDGGKSDVHEQHADRVADAVVAGESAAPILSELAPEPSADRGSDVVQRDKLDDGIDDADGISYAPALAISPSTLMFGGIPVGDSSELRRVTITNTDKTRDVEVDTFSDLSGEAAGEFTVAGVNAPLKPGQSASVGITFAPSRAGDRVGQFMIGGSHGAAGWLKVNGYGTESVKMQEKREKREEGEVDAARKDKAVTYHHERTAAEAEVDKWKDKTWKLLEGCAYWSSVNWTRFLSETGGDFTVAWTEGQFMNAVGAVLSGMVGLMVPGGPLVGALAGSLFSEIWGGYFTAKGNAAMEQAVHDNLKKTGKAMEEKADQFETEKDRALATATTTQRSSEHKIWTLNDPDQIEQIGEWARQESALIQDPPKKSDRSLYQKMLKEWVLERAGDAGHANKYTNSPAWKDARDASFGKGKALEVPDLFIHQAAREWSQLGIDWEKGIADIQAQFDKAKAEGVGFGLDGEDLASYIHNTMGDVWGIMRVFEPSQTAKVLQEINVNRDKHDYSGRYLSCELWLKRDGASITVWQFSYHLDGRIGERSLR